MTPAPPLRLLLAEDHALFRAGLRHLLTDHGFDVVGEAPNGEVAVRLASELRPDIVVMDLHMPIMSGVEAAGRITRSGIGAKVLMLTMSEDSSDVVDAVIAGASGYLLKDAEPEEIARAVRAAAEGEMTIAPAVTGAIVEKVRLDRGANDVAERAGAQLSDRETEILRLLADGLDNPEIGERLHLSPSTVKNHVSSILDKLGVESRVQAAVRAARAGIV
jgi:DNA-binding NarL/FixJ family response regulator